MRRGLPTAIVALVIGLVAAGIARRQTQIASAKLKLDLFEQRYAIFLAVWRALSAPSVENVNLDEELTGVANLPSQTAFLFGWELGRYVRDVRDKLARYRDLAPSGETLRESAASELARKAERNELRAWFAGESARNCHERFKSFLNFSAWK